MNEIFSRKKITLNFPKKKKCIVSKPINEMRVYIENPTKTVVKQSLILFAFRLLIHFLISLTFSTFEIHSQYFILFAFYKKKSLILNFSGISVNKERVLSNK